MRGKNKNEMPVAWARNWENLEDVPVLMVNGKIYEVKKEDFKIKYKKAIKEAFPH